MRAAPYIQLLLFTLLSTGSAAPPREGATAPDAKDAIGPKKDTASPLNDQGKEVTAGGAQTDTIFNGQAVPEIQSIKGTELDKTISKGHWLVEFYSPNCGHCKAFAPTWQTLYELYYTSDPLPASKEPLDPAASLNSFTRYYDFHFARVNCLASGDACADKKIHSFPTVVLFNDGEEVKHHVGATDLATISEFVEESLESIRPGSRAKEGMKLPTVGADHVEGVKPPVPQQKDKDVAKGKEQGLKQNVIADELELGSASATKTKATLQATKVPKGEANVAGKSVPLTAENFQRLVTTTRDPWFVKFYAPWCHHCQALAPVWAAMARDMKGKMNIGEVNCEAEKRLCKDVHIKGYPTMLYFQGGERIEYEGLRGLGDLLSFANKAVSAGEGVQNVNAAEFEAMEQTEEVIFLYLYDHATTSEDFEALERLVLSLIGHARLVKTNDELLYKRFKISTWPRLLVSRDGKPTYFTALAPKDMRDYRKVLGWMQSVWQPIVPELTAANARDIMDRRLVVLAILSRERSDEFIIARREIKNAALEWIDKQTQAYQLERQELRDAKQLRIEEAEDRNDQRGLRSAKSIRINMDDIERKEVGFAWVDGVFWERWVKTTFGINVKDGERVVVNDEENRRYWDNTITGNPIVPSRTSILETLPKIVASPPKISPKSTASFFGHLLFSFQRGVGAHPLVSLGIVLGLLLTLGMWARGHMRKGKQWGSGGLLQLPLTKEGNGFLGGNGGSGQGKVD